MIGNLGLQLCNHISDIGCQVRVPTAQGKKGKMAKTIACKGKHNSPILKVKEISAFSVNIFKKVSFVYVTVTNHAN